MVGAWFLAGTGFGALFLGGILDVAAFIRSGRHDFTNLSEYNGWYTTTKGLAVAGDVLVVLGVATAVAGLVWLYLHRKRHVHGRAS